MPSTGNGSKGNNQVEYEMMPSIKKVADYGNFSIHDALNLPCDMFLLMFKNATILELMQTEEGREYLAKCERLNNTEIDLDGLLEVFGGSK